MRRGRGDHGLVPLQFFGYAHSATAYDFNERDRICMSDYFEMYRKQVTGNSYCLGFSRNSQKLIGAYGEHGKRAGFEHFNARLSYFFFKLRIFGTGIKDHPFRF